MNRNDNDRSDRDERLEAILVSCIEASEAGQGIDRQALLARHPEFAAELSEFLAGRADMQRLAAPLHADIDAPTIGFEGNANVSAKVEYFGDYHLLEEIGRGGMGVVYKARQESLNRTVALKMILTGQLANAADVKRFRAEAEAAAKLDHPGIVPVFEVGEHEGHQYFSMAYIEGESLAHRLIDGLPKPRDAALLVKQVAEAVTYAHVEGVVHRDIKPANILIDKHGQARLTDFGLAKSVRGEPGASATGELTTTGQILGTPSYMPPEQASGKRDVGPLADVYSLGAVLYCLLTGRPPFQADNPLDTLMQVLQKEPVAPRQLNASVPRDLETICLKCLEKEPRKRYGSAQELVADLGRFLDGQPIVARPTGRVERVIKFAKRRPAAAVLILVLACAWIPPVVTGMIFVGETNRARVDAINMGQAANNAAQNANEAFAEADRQRKAANDANYAAQVQAKKADDANQAAQAQAKKAEGVLLTANSVQVRPDNPGLSLLLAIEGSKRHRDALANHALWDAMEACREVYTLDHSKTVNAAVNAAEFSPDGKWALTCSGDGAARIWDVATGKELRVLKEGSRFTSVVLGRFSPDGRRVLTITHPHRSISPGTLISGGTGVSGALDDESWKNMISVARLWDPANGKLIASWWQPYREGNYTFASPISAEFSPNSRLVAAAFGIHPGGTVEVRDAETGKLVSTLTGHQNAVVSAGFSPDSSKVVTASVDNTARIHETASGKLVHELKGHTAGVMSARFSPNGKRVLTYGHGVDHKRMARGYDTYEDAAARLWDAETGKELPALLWGGDLKTWVWNASFNHDGTQIVTSGVDYFSEKHFAIWDAATGKSVVAFKGEFGGRRMKAISTVFSPDGKRVASANADQTASIWDATSGEELIVLSGHDAGVRTVAFSADGRLLITTADDKTARIWDVADRDISVRRRMLPWQTNPPIFNADGRRMYTLPIYKGSTPGTSVIDTHTGKTIAQAPIEAAPLGIGYTSGTVESRWLAFVAPNSENAMLQDITIKDAATLQDRFRLPGHEKRVAALAFSPDETNSRAASIDEAEKVRLWNMADGKLLHTLFVDADHPMQQVHFDGTGSRLLTVNPPRRESKTINDGVCACVWDVAKGTKLITLRATHSKAELDKETAGPITEYSLAKVAGAVFSADGERVLLTFESYAGSRVFNATTGEQIHVLQHHSDIARVAAISPDGKQIITGSGGKRAWIWDTATGKLLRTLDHEGTVNGVAFSPRGRLVMTASDYKAIRVWDADTGQLVAHFKDPVGMVRGAFSSDGQSVMVIYLRPDGASSGKCSARIWPIDPLAEAIQRKPRELTAAERLQFGVKVEK